MAAVMSRNRNDISKLRDMMDECKAMHIQVKGPDVNESFGSFGVNKQGDIRFGIAAIKGVGENVAADIIKSRKSGGPFKSIYDFVERVPLSSLNRRTFESLANAGAFDCFADVKREDYFYRNNRDETLSEQLLRYGQLYQQASMQQSASLFGDEDLSLNTAGRPVIKPAIEWPAAIKLEKERELVGMYLSANPLDPYYMELNFGCTCSIKDFTEGEKEENKTYTFGGMVTGYENKISKSGSNYGRITLEDYTGSTDIMLFKDDYIKFGNYGKVSAHILVSGYFKPNYRGELSFRPQNIRLLEDVKDKMLSGINLELSTVDISDNLIEMINEQSGRPTNVKGALNIYLYDPEINRTVKFVSGLRVPMDREFVDILDSLDVKYSFEKQIV